METFLLKKHSLKKNKFRGTIAIPSNGIKAPFEYRGVWMPEGDVINVSKRNLFPVSGLRLILNGSL